jgi:iron complex outermembrane receptor protein
MKRIAVLLAFVTVITHPARGNSGQEPENTTEVSLDSLLNTKVIVDTRVNAAAKYDQTTSGAPASITIITGDDIERFGYRTLEDVFRSVRGFYVSNDRNYSYVGVRGFSRPTDFNNRILILLNGQTVNEPFYYSAFTGTEFPINMDMIERIEIVRGPGSALYGASAMFAVVNIITKTSDEIEGTRVSADAGSFDTYGTRVSVVKELSSGMDLALSGRWADSGGQDLYFEEYDDPATNSGVAEGKDWDESYSLFANLDTRNFRIQAMTFSREKGVPTGSYSTVFNEDGTSTLDELTLVQVELDKDIDEGKNISSRISYNHYHYWGNFPYSDGEDADPVYALDENFADRVGINIQYLWDIRSSNRLTVGTEYQNVPRAQYHYWDEFTTYFDDDFPYTIFSLYLQDDFQVRENLSLLGGMRWDTYSTVGSAVAPRAAILYNPFSWTTIKLLYGEAYRAPTIFELYFYDPINHWRSNEALEPERLRTMELVWEQKLSERFFGLASVYSNRMHQLIDSTVEPADSSKQFRNMGQVRANGVELELQMRLAKGMRGSASYVFQDAHDHASDARLTNFPHHAVKLGFAAPLYKSLYGSADLLYETDRVTIYNTRTEPYFLTNATLTTKQLRGHLGISLQVRNVFDVEYGTPGGYEHVQDIIMQDGRTFTFRLEYR